MELFSIRIQRTFQLVSTIFAVAQARNDAHAGYYLLNSIGSAAGWASGSNTNTTYRRCMTYSVRPVIDPDIQDNYKKYLPE